MSYYEQLWSKLLGSLNISANTTCGHLDMTSSCTAPERGSRSNSCLSNIGVQVKLKRRLGMLLLTVAAVGVIRPCTLHQKVRTRFIHTSLFLPTLRYSA